MKEKEILERMPPRQMISGSFVDEIGRSSLGSELIGFRVKTCVLSADSSHMGSDYLWC